MRIFFERIADFITRVFDIALQNFLFGLAVFSAAVAPLTVMLMFAGTYRLIAEGAHPVRIAATAANSGPVLGLVAILTLLAVFLAWWLVFARILLTWRGSDHSLHACVMLVRKRFLRLLGVISVLLLILGGFALVAGLAGGVLVDALGQASFPILMMLFFAFGGWFQVRFLPVFAVALMEDGIGIFGSISRAYALTIKTWIWLFLSLVIVALLMVMLERVIQYLAFIPELGVVLLFAHFVFAQIVGMGVAGAAYMTLIEDENGWVNSR